MIGAPLPMVLLTAHAVPHTTQRHLNVAPTVLPAPLRVPKAVSGRVRNPQRPDFVALDRMLQGAGFGFDWARMGRRGDDVVQWSRALTPGYRSRVTLVSPRRPGRADLLVYGVGVLVCSNGLTIGQSTGHRLSHALSAPVFEEAHGGFLQAVEDYTRRLADWTWAETHEPAVPTYNRTFFEALRAGLVARNIDDAQLAVLNWSAPAELANPQNRLESYNLLQGLATGRVETDHAGRRAVAALPQVGHSVTRARVSEAVRVALGIPNA